MTADAKRSNRLAGETSPYLLLHAHNPVNWYPWGDEALERARAEDKPIFLSVGYATCYWCHVMERESFSEPAIAALMNDRFVNIKIDREERPELDEIYMAATQILSGQGGWPNSLFLTPGLAPFYAGTYFPPTDRQGMPGFPTVLRSLADAWHERRDDVEQQATELVDAMRRYLESAPPTGPVDVDAIVEEAYVGLERSFDAQNGGFGGAPKFPTPSNLLFLEELAADRARAQEPARAEEPALAEELLGKTLDAMAMGGLYDQLGGGFHRYATDAEWKVPHFEKMLYDNGLLLEVYAREGARSGDPERKRVVLETAEFLAREMTSSGGGFFSALDAETDGFEGAFYVWTREQLAWALGEEAFGFLAPLYGFDGPAFFEQKYYVLHLPASWTEQAARRRTATDELLDDIAPLRRRLFAERAERQPVATDDKLLTDWNGIAIRGLAVAGRLFDEPRLVEQATAAANHLLAIMRSDGRPLQHAWRDEVAKVDAFLGDYVFLVRGLLALHEASSGEERCWLATAVELTEEQIERLGNPSGGFFLAEQSDDVLLRSRDAFDGAIPSTNAVAVLNLIDLAAHTGDERWSKLAAASLVSFGPLAQNAPTGMRTMAVALRRYEAAFGRLEDVSAAPLLAELELSERLKDGSRTFRLSVSLASGWHLGEVEQPLELSARGVALELSELPEQADAGATGSFSFAGKVGEFDEKAELVVRHQLCDDAQCWPLGEFRMLLAAFC